MSASVLVDKWHSIDDLQLVTRCPSKSVLAMAYIQCIYQPSWPVACWCSLYSGQEGWCGRYGGAAKGPWPWLGNGAWGGSEHRPYRRRRIRISSSHRTCARGTLHNASTRQRRRLTSGNTNSVQSRSPLVGCFVQKRFPATDLCRRRTFDLRPRVGPSVTGSLGRLDLDPEPAGRAAWKSAAHAPRRGFNNWG